MKTNKIRSSFSMKTFFYIFTTFMLIMLYVSLRDLKSTNEKLLAEKYMQNLEPLMERVLLKLNEDDELRRKESGMKYILQWTSPTTMPFAFMGKGQQAFIEKNCTFKNCYVTNNRTLLGDYTKFDVIAFHGPEVIRMAKSSLPDRRSLRQKYVFGSMESSDYYPVCSDKFNDYFNWTWTYKLEPYAKWGYLTVRDLNNNIIGPKDVTHWIKLSEMEPVSTEFRNKLKTKKKAAAWFVSNCNSRSGREVFVKKLQDELKQYNLDVDIYGGCGPFRCSRDSENACDKVVENDYYFYLSFENSFAEDYVTEKLLRPLIHDAVPIVYGAANYTRFMPDGIYLNARELGVEKLARRMHEIIQNPDTYADFFRWKNHYYYHDSLDYVDSDYYCGFCEMLNNDEYVRSFSVIKDFRKWWDPPGRC
ncbi:alpha-(1,3)-fucosyltransferase C-like [Bicyclus anynana]|uniref:Fucosyltransferase n=1 Tax=Bicyclus anynana TaxID=110368 RepID=A0A6J1NNR0_BICAN|nr:alpha-(1,3)-fucosyltransferase C-like [Bicyclus anynana]